MSEYFNNIYSGIKTLISGMSLSLQHFQNRKKLVATLQYPHEKWPVPERDIGHANEDYNVIRSRLHVDIDDCISCRMCERACPVDCIKIEDVKPKKGTDFDCGITSNDTQKKLLVSRFSIDMSECMYCNLCVYPCPEECIYMVGGPNEHKHDIDYEFSKRERGNLIYEFATATDDEIAQAGGADYLEKRNKKTELYEQAMRVQEIELEGADAAKTKSKSETATPGADLPQDITLLKQIKNRVSKAIARKTYRQLDKEGKSLVEIAEGIQSLLDSKDRLTEDVKTVVSVLSGTSKKATEESVSDSAPQESSSSVENIDFNIDSLKSIESRVVRGIAKKIYKAQDSEGKDSKEIALAIKLALEEKEKYTDDVKVIIEPVLSSNGAAETVADNNSNVQEGDSSGEIDFNLESLNSIENRIAKGIAKKLFKQMDSEGKTIQEISQSIKQTLEEKGKYTDDIKAIIE